LVDEITPNPNLNKSIENLICRSFLSAFQALFIPLNQLISSKIVFKHFIKKYIKFPYH